jgi:hypothetical protein
MQGRLRLLAALLTLAALLGWLGVSSARAFECPRPAWLSEGLSENELRDRAQRLAEKEADGARLIFSGRVRSAQHLGRDSQGFGADLVSYDVVEWFKGLGGDHVKLIEVYWCDGSCQGERHTSYATSAGDSYAIVIAGSTEWVKRDVKLRSHARNADGARGASCGPLTLRHYSPPEYLKKLPPEDSLHRVEKTERLLSEAGANKLEELRRRRTHGAF